MNETFKQQTIKFYESDSGLPRFEGRITGFINGNDALSLLDKIKITFPDIEKSYSISKLETGKFARVFLDNLNLDELHKYISNTPAVLVSGFSAGPGERGYMRCGISQISDGKTTDTYYLELLTKDTNENRKKACELLKELNISGLQKNICQ